ncbi:MAG: hypothetical protein NC818_00190 [Candidatus Omnitrophica bacterium]|nr:hypothetical protein [Candidatus Omnitrophota bacterium]
MKIKLLIPALSLILLFITSSPSSAETERVAHEDADLLNKYIHIMQEKSLYLKGIPSSDINIKLPVDVNCEYLNSFLGEIRRKGLPIGAYKLDKTNDIEKLPPPFLTYLNGSGWVIVVDKSLSGYIIKDNKTGVSREISQSKFISSWVNIILSPLLCGTWLWQYCQTEKEANDFYIIYSYHDEDFDSIRKALDEIMDLATKKGRRLVYIDELGLIPLDTVNNYIKIYGLSEKEAFDKIKIAISEENKNIEKGIPLYDSLDTYSKIYNYLAEHKIKVITEDLEYINWRKIVLLDYLNNLQFAVRSFFCGNIDLYLDFIKDYNYGYWEYNIKERDNNFIQQIEAVIKDNPEDLFFTIRGIGHSGLEEMLTKRGFQVKFIVLGEGFTINNLTYKHFIQLCNNINVYLGDDKQLYIFSLVQEYLRNYFFIFRKLNSRIAVIEANKLIEKINVDDILALSKAIYESIKDSGLLQDEQKVSKYIYDWVVSKIGIINKE